MLQHEIYSLEQQIETIEQSKRNCKKYTCLLYSIAEQPALQQIKPPNLRRTDLILPTKSNLLLQNDFNKPLPHYMPYASLCPQVQLLYQLFETHHQNAVHYQLHYY
jgi:hypothetical protein